MCTAVIADKQRHESRASRHMQNAVRPGRSSGSQFYKEQAGRYRTLPKQVSPARHGVQDLKGFKARLKLRNVDHTGRVVWLPTATTRIEQLFGFGIVKCKRQELNYRSQKCEALDLISKTCHSHKMLCECSA